MTYKRSTVLTLKSFLLFLFKQMLPASSAWDQAPQWRKRRKNRRTKRAERQSKKGWWGGGWKCGAALSPSPGHPSARFFRRYFSYLTPFYAFFPHCGAWSRANDSYAMILEKIPLNDKITASCLQHIIVNYKQQKGTLKNCQVNKFSKTAIKICFNLLQVYQSLLSFVFVVSFIPSSTLLQEINAPYKLRYWKLTRLKLTRI